MLQILAIVIVVLLVTLIGHGFWLVLAALWNMISRRTQRCQVCSGVLQHGRCLQCGWSGAFPNPSQPLELTRQILRQAYAQGLIDKQQLDSISQAVTCVVVSPDALDTPSTPSSLVSDVASERGSNQPNIALDAEIVEAELVEDNATPIASSEPDDAAESPKPTIPFTAPFPRPQPVQPTADVAARAAEYARRRAAVVAEPVQSVPPTEPPKPKRSFNEVFAAFMEEKNIRWGEVVGGLLIVSCSIALVVSFWAQIAAMPLLKFGVFTGVTAALFGVGLHASHRWKLPTTSQGVLMIAMLLVPLNFLALASFTDSQQVTALTILGELISLGIFSFCGYHAAKVLTPKTPALSTCIVASLSVFHLLVRRFVPVETNQLTALGIYAPAIGIFTLSVLPAYWCHRTDTALQLDESAQEEPSADRSHLIVQLAEIWKGLGLATFAFVLLTSFLVLRSNDAQETVQAISPVSSLMAMPLLLTGMIVGRMATVRRLSAEVIAATSVGLSGVLVLLSGCVLAVPRPGMMILTSCLSGAVLLGLGQAVRIRQVHYASGAMWAAAATLLGLVVRGQIQWNANSLRLLLDAILSAETGFLLTGVAVVFAALFIVLRRMGQPTFADIYGHLSGVAAAIGFLFVTGFGFGRIESATSVCLLYVLYAIGCYVAAHVSGRRWLEGIGATLLTLASAQAIAFPVEPHWGWAAAWSLAAAVASTVLYVIDFGYRTWRKTPFDPAAPTPQAAILNNAAASILSIASLLVVRDAPHYALFLSVALLWLVSAVLQQAKECYWAHQGFLLLAAVAGVHRAIHLQPWYQAVPLGDLHPQATQWYALAIVAIVGLWKVLRSSLDSVAAKQPILIRLSELTRHQAVERLTHGFALICLLWLVLYAVFPGVIQELAPRGASLDTIRISVETASGTVERQVVDPASLQVFRLPHQAAAGRGTWWLLIGCLVLTGIDWMAGRKSQRMIRPAVSMLLAIIGLGFILFAANWNAQLATASAVRWSTSVYFLLASAALWIYARIASRKLNVEQNKSTSPDQCRADLWRWFGVFTTVTLLPLASMLVAVVMMCFLIRGSNLGMQLWSTSWLATGLLLGAVLVGVERTVSRFQILRDDHLQKMRMVVAPSVVLLAMPMIAMFVYLLARILGSHPITGPNPGSVFANMGVNRSFTIPMLLLAVGLVGNAICLRSAELGLASSLVFNLCATSAYLMAVGNAGMSTDHWLQLAELNSLVSTIFALAWLLYLWLRYGEPLDTQGLQRWLVPQWIIAVVPFLASLAVIAWIIMIEGRTTTTFVRSAGIAGWANLLSLGVLAWFSRRTLFGSLRWEGLVPWCGAATTALLAGQATVIWPATFSAAHVMVLGLLLACLLATALHWRTDGTVRSLRLTTVLLTLGLAAYCVLSIYRSPWHPWLSMAGLLVATACAASGSLAAKRQRYLVWASVLWEVAFVFWWAHVGHKLGVFENSGYDFASLNVAILALPSVVSVWLKARKEANLVRWKSILSLHHLMMAFMLMAVAMLAFVHWQSDNAQLPRPSFLLAIAATAITIWATHWDRQSHRQPLLLYGLGLICVAPLLQAFRLEPKELPWSVAVVLSAYSLAASYLFSRRHGLRQFLVTCKFLPAWRTADGDTSSSLADPWGIVGANLMLAAVVASMGLFTQFQCDVFSLRFVAAQAVLAQMAAIGLLADGARAARLRQLTFVMGSVGVVCCGWSFLHPNVATLYDRTAVMAIALALCSGIFGLALAKIVRIRNAWTAAAESVTPGLLASSAAMLLLALSIEVGLYVSRGDSPAWPIALALLAMQGMLVAASLMAALVPGRDPLGLSESKRTAYVYAAEMFLMLMAVHARIAFPYLFTGWVQQLWPVMIMAIAFAGIGLSEIASRRKIAVLAGPLHNTGALLPLLPALGFWLLPSNVHYSFVMLMVGVAYGVLASMRKSFGFGILAALAINGGFWYQLHDSTIAFWTHPQVWLIPPALCVLFATYWNRNRIASSTAASVRAGASAVIYVSSTAEIFLNGVGNAPWLPIVLAVLSIAGIMAGIWLRIRSFLFLGISFLAVSLMTVIWFAAVDLQQTWIWYVSGILAGVAILVLFAIFEKRRQDVLRLMDKLGQWEK